MADTTRTAELRRKLEKDPGSRLFAQLAEELRKEGRFEDAIGVCRQGLEKNPNYPSARLTLARALLDSGRPADARPELEQIVKASPDNIMASRLLADACEDLGDLGAGLKQYEQTLRLSPGDKGILEKIGELKKKLATPAPAAPPPVELAPVIAELPSELPSVDEPPAVAVAESLPSVDGPEGPQTLPVGKGLPPSAPPTVSAQALDRDLSSGTLSPGTLSVSEFMHFEAANATHGPAADAPVAELPSVGLPSVPERQEEVIVEQTISFGQAQAAVPSTQAIEAAPVDDAGAQTLPLTSVTLADLYLQQGLKAEASAVLSQVLKEEPNNAEARAKLAQMSAESAETALASAPAAWPTAPIAPLPASAVPAAIRDQPNSARRSEAEVVTGPIAGLPVPNQGRARTKAEAKEQSILALKAFLGAVEREATDQRATERGAF